jgi:hypothetical protein
VVEAETSPQEAEVSWLAELAVGSEVGLAVGTEVGLAVGTEVGLGGGTVLLQLQMHLFTEEQLLPDEAVFQKTEPRL